MNIPAENQRQIFETLTIMGYDLTFRRPASQGGTYDDSTGTVSGGSDDDETARGVFLNRNLRGPASDLVERGDRLLALSALYQGAALSKTPQVGDQFLTEGAAQTAVEVQTVKGRSSVIGYLILTRGP